MSDLMTRDAGTSERVTTPGWADGPEWARHIDFVVRSLQSRFGPTVEPDVIRAEVEAGFAEYSGARVREFVPILVESRVRSRFLRAPSP